METKYEDMIDLARPVSAKHPPMSRQNRAAQFAPFAALTGYDAAVRETARLTEAQIELDESAKAELDRKLQLLAANIDDLPEAAFTYFEPDKKKVGGAYVSVTGQVKAIDQYAQLVVLADGTRIPIRQIYAISSPLLTVLEFE